MAGFDDMRKLADFTIAFNEACRNYSHTTEFESTVKTLLNSRTIDNTDVVLRKLTDLAEAYPGQATAVFKKAMESEIDLTGVKLPAGKTFEESFQKFVQPMLTVLKA